MRLYRFPNCIFIAMLLSTLSTSAAQVSGLPVGPGGSSFSLVETWNDADLAAFVDVNADRRTDALVYSAKTTKVDVLMAPSPKHAGGKPQREDLFHVNLTTPGTEKLVSMVAADFNGDSRVDYLLVFSSDNPLKYSASVVFGKTMKKVPVGEFVAQPAVCDVNADMIADIYGELVNGTRVVYLGQPAKFMEFAYTTKIKKWSSLGYAGFASLGVEANPSLVVLTEESTLEVYSGLVSPSSSAVTLQPREINLSGAIGPAIAVKRLGKFVFGDFDMSGNIKLLLTGCKTESCRGTSFLVLCDLSDVGKCDNVEVDWTPDGGDLDGEWSLAPGDSGFSSSGLIGPSFGDYDLDGFPDLAVGLAFHPTDNGSSLVVPAILRNTRPPSANGVIRFKAFLLPGVSPPSTEAGGLRQIAFFDFNENGVLDLFVSYNTPDGDPVTSLYVHKMASEAYFLKVMMTTGLCGSPSQCTSGALPYGLPGYGFRASYETQGAEGTRIRASGVFVTSSCCGSLQSAFSTFGFADFATYIENVTVSVPATGLQKRSHTLTFIVPNAQVVIIPYPLDSPSDWQAKLFLEPLYDMKVIYVAITLLVTCALLLIVVTVLQCFEVRSDRAEKAQESHRFHFDAM